MINKKWPAILFIITHLTYMYAQSTIEVHGHRGCRGLFPENSIPGFLHAIDLGVDVLELDVVVNGEGELVVSHEPWMNSDICLTNKGDSIVGSHAHNLFHMKQVEIEAYDCGSKPFRRFPEQHKVSTIKPRFKDLVSAINGHTENADQVRYNIEIKLTEDWIGKYCPTREDFLKIYTKTMFELGLQDRVILQCFDLKVLQMAHRQELPFKLALLVQNIKGFRRNIKKLGFCPDIYSPHHKVLTSKSVRRAKKRGVFVVPWTVNSPKAIQKMIELQVDAIISDYPDLVIESLR